MEENTVDNGSCLPHYWRPRCDRRGDSISQLIIFTFKQLTSTTMKTSSILLFASFATYALTASASSMSFQYTAAKATKAKAIKANTKASKSQEPVRR